MRQLGPAILGEVAGEERPLLAQFLAFRVQVVHELVNQGDGYLLHLALGVRHLALKNIPCGVYTSLGIGVQHGFPLCCEQVERDVVLDVLGDQCLVLFRSGSIVISGEHGIRSYPTTPSHFALSYILWCGM